MTDFSAQDECGSNTIYSTSPQSFSIRNIKFPSKYSFLYAGVVKNAVNNDPLIMEISSRKIMVYLSTDAILNAQEDNFEI